MGNIPTAQQFRSAAQQYRAEDEYIGSHSIEGVEASIRKVYVKGHLDWVPEDATFQRSVKGEAYYQKFLAPKVEIVGVENGKQSKSE